MNEEKKQFSILVVDDEPKNIQLIGSILSQEGYSIEFATSGREALEWVHSKPFDLILLDIIMPEMNGFEVCKKLKTNEKTRDIPVMFITIREGTEDEVAGLDLGAVDYIAKPLRPQVLQARVKNQLKLRESHRKLKRANQKLQEALDRITLLKGFLPICSKCKKLRKPNSNPNKKESWVILEDYITDFTRASFSHGICPTCRKELYPDLPFHGE